MIPTIKFSPALTAVIGTVVLLAIFPASARAETVDETLVQTCVKYPENDPSPPVEVCKDQMTYSFRIIDDVTTFKRSEFELSIVNAAAHWLKSHNKSTDLLDESTVQIWMSVPEANPAAAQPRAIVDTTAGRVSFWFDLKADHWEFFDEEAAILGDATYPESFGYRPLRILIRAQPGVSSSAVEAALTQSGATNVSNDGYSWYSATTDLFAEKEVAFRILKNHNDILKYAQINSVVEWIADRQMAFSFSGNLEK